MTEKQNDTIRKLLESVMEEVDLSPLDVEAVLAEYDDIAVSIRSEIDKKPKKEIKKEVNAAAGANSPLQSEHSGKCPSA